MNNTQNSSRRTLAAFVRLMRPHHWIKNGLIFLPLACGGQLFQSSLLKNTLLGFAAFCLITSAVYILNDIRDKEQDRLHESKRSRPLASGAVSVRSAWVLCGLMLPGAALLAIGAGGAGLWPHLWMLLYLVINIAYSFGLKNYPVIDVIILAAGFLLRLLYGSAVTGIEISNWLYLTVISFSLYLGLGKRRNELSRGAKDGSPTRKVLATYSLNFLDKNMYMCLALTIAFYALWTVDPVTAERISGNRLVWTVPLLIVICMKYSLNVESDSHGDPVDVVLHDKVLLFLTALFLLAVGLIVYL